MEKIITPLPAYCRSLADRQQLVRPPLIFKGEAQNPLLAPRAVWTTGSKLLIADTAQNRIFIWHQLPTSEYAPPDLTLGQQQSTNTARNSGGISAASLQYPSGLWSDGKKLIVADAWNHRVLIWHSFPTHNGQPADVVIGQADFHSGEPNAKGIGAAPTAKSLYWPYGVFSDGTQLWIADTGNRRVLYFRRLPLENNVAADGVIGKPDLTTRDYENHEPIWPYTVRISARGALCIADTQYYRVLLWHQWQKAFTQPADVIVGQADFDSNGMNRFGLQPSESSLSWVYDAFFDDAGLWIADTGNSRLLYFQNLPQNHAAMADNLIGHDNFRTGSENAETKLGTEHQLYWPFSLCLNQHQLFVADTGNHRVLIYERNYNN
jgi:hypothetical protein